MGAKSILGFQTVSIEMFTIFYLFVCLFDCHGIMLVFHMNWLYDLSSPHYMQVHKTY